MVTAHASAKLDRAMRKRDVRTTVYSSGRCLPGCINAGVGQDRALFDVALDVGVRDGAPLVGVAVELDAAELVFDRLCGSSDVSFRAEQNDNGVVVEVESSAPRGFGQGGSRPGQGGRPARA